MNERVVFFGAFFALGCAAFVAGWSTGSSVCVADESAVRRTAGERTTYLPPYRPSDAPEIPLLKRQETVLSSETTQGVGSVASTDGPRVGDSGTFVAADGKTYFYRFVEGTRCRTFIETRRVLETPPGASGPVWVERKFLRRVDEPRLVKQIWPAETLSSPPFPCRPVGAADVASTSENYDASEPSVAAPTIYRASARRIIP